MSVLPPSSLKGGVGPVLVIVFLLQLLLVLLLLSLGLRVPPLCHLVRYGLVILVEVMRDKTEAEGSRDAALFLSVSIRSLYVPLTGTHDNRGVGGLVR